MGVVQILVAESRWNGVNHVCVGRIVQFVVGVCRINAAIYSPFGLDQVVGMFIAQAKTVKDIAFLPYEIGCRAVANFVFEVLVRECDSSGFN